MVSSSRHGHRENEALHRLGASFEIIIVIIIIVIINEDDDDDDEEDLDVVVVNMDACTHRCRCVARATEKERKA